LHLVVIFSSAISALVHWVLCCKLQLSHAIEQRKLTNLLKENPQRNARPSPPLNDHPLCALAMTLSLYACASINVSIAMIATKDPFVLNRFSHHESELVSACYPKSSHLLDLAPEFKPPSQELSRLTYTASNKPGLLPKIAKVRVHPSLLHVHPGRPSGSPLPHGSLRVPVRG
jgi:hypothetical protein